MKVVLALAAAILVAVPFTAPATAADPLTCAGYPEGRVFLESQSWWSDAGVPAGGAARHSHSGTCFPLYQHVRGTLHLDIRSMIHNDPGARLEFVRVQAAQSAYGSINMKILNPKTPCAGHDCTFWTGIDVDLSSLPTSGWWEFRIHTEVQSADTSRQLATNGWLAYVENGKSTGGGTVVPFPQVEGRGWYRLPNRTVFGYENARLVTPLPDAPVSCTWTPSLRTLAGAGGEAIVRSRVTIDPALHAVPENPGWVLVDQAGTFQGQVPIDTTKLANGAHRLVIIGTANEPNSTKLSGVISLPFVVQNGASGCGSAPPPPPPPPPPPSGHTVTVKSPTAGATVSGTITLDATADATPTKMEYYVDGALVASDSTAPAWDEPWNSNSVAPGGHTLVARATIDGSKYDSAPVSFTVADRPAVIVTYPTAGAVVSGTIRIDASAPTASRIDYYVDGAHVGYDATAPKFDESWNTKTVANGTHTIVARATINGVQQDSAPVTFQVRN